MKQNPCPIKGCQRNISPTSPYGICASHTDTVNCLLWALPKVKTQSGRDPKTKLVLPGQQEFVVPQDIKTPAGGKKL